MVFRGAGAAAARPAAPILAAPNTLSTNKSAAPGNTHLAAAQQSNQAPPGCNTS